MQVTIPNTFYYQPSYIASTEVPIDGVRKVVALTNAIVSTGKQVRLWDPQQLTPIALLTAQEKEVLSVVELTNGMFITGTENGKMDFWSPNGEHVTRLDDQLEVTGFNAMCAITPEMVVTGACQKPKTYTFDWRNNIKIWNILEKKCQYSLKGHTGGISKIIPLDGNNLIASCSGDSSIRIWNIKNRESLKIFKTIEKVYLYGLVKYQNDYLLTAGSDRKIRAIHIPTKKELATLKDGKVFAHTSSVYDINTNNCHTLVSGSRDGYIKLWDLRIGKCINYTSIYDRFIQSVDFTKEGNIIAGTSGEKYLGTEKEKSGYVVLWDFRSLHAPVASVLNSWWEGKR